MGIEPHELTPHHILGYVKDMLDRGLRPTTRWARLPPCALPASARRSTSSSRRRATPCRSRRGREKGRATHPDPAAAILIVLSAAIWSSLVGFISIR